MYWHQKAQMVCDTPAHLDTLTRNITNYLNNLTLRNPATIDNSTSSTVKPSLIIIAEYMNQADADGAWTQVKNAQSNAWIEPPSWAGYATFNDNDSIIQLIERIDWV